MVLCISSFLSRAQVLTEKSGESTEKWKSLFIEKEVNIWSWWSKEQFAWNALVKIPEGEGFKF